MDLARFIPEMCNLRMKHWILPTQLSQFEMSLFPSDGLLHGVTPPIKLYCCVILQVLAAVFLFNTVSLKTCFSNMCSDALLEPDSELCIL